MLILWNFFNFSDILARLLLLSLRGWFHLRFFTDLGVIIEEIIFSRINCDSFVKSSSLDSYIGIIPDNGIMVRVFANGLGDLDSIPGRVIPKTQKMILDATLLNTQQYKIRINGKVEQSKEKSSALPYQKGSLRITLDYDC